MGKMRCCVCGRFVSEFTGYHCENCDGQHHKRCSGEDYEGHGEYLSETAYSICKKCIVVGGMK